MLFANDNFDNHIQREKGAYLYYGIESWQLPTFFILFSCPSEWSLALQEEISSELHSKNYPINIMCCQRNSFLLHTSIFGVDACINSFTFRAPNFSASFSTPECGFFDTWTPKNSKLVTAFISVLLSRANCTQQKNKTILSRNFCSLKSWSFQID